MSQGETSSHALISREPLSSLRVHGRLPPHCVGLVCRVVSCSAEWAETGKRPPCRQVLNLPYQAPGKAAVLSSTIPEDFATNGAGQASVRSRSVETTLWTWTVDEPTIALAGDYAGHHRYILSRWKVMSDSARNRNSLQGSVARKTWQRCIVVPERCRIGRINAGSQTQQSRQDAGFGTQRLCRSGSRLKVAYRNRRDNSVSERLVMYSVNL